MCALLLGSGLCRADVIDILSNEGSGQDGLAYAGIPAAAFSTAFSVVAVGKTTGAAHDTVSLIQFDLSGVTATSDQVTSATLTLFAVSSKVVNATNLDPDAAHPIEIAVSPVSGAWNRNSLSWLTKPAHGAVETTFQVDAINDFFTVDVTDLVKAWIDTPASNFGLWLEATTVMGSGPNGDASPFYAVAFNSGFETAANGGGPNENAPQLTIAAVPEPASGLLVLVAAPALAWARARSARRRALDGRKK
jgi:hypothetical protein